jgi:1-acyl-sn-glycerol-3-phosphate acyltransferase
MRDARGSAPRWMVTTQLACRGLLRLLGVRVAVRGACTPEPALVVANHLSWLDILAVLSRVRCTFVAKREVRRWPLFGWLGARLGVVWVDRSRKRDLLRSIPALQTQLEAGRSVLLFAEGTTSAGNLLPFRSALVEAAVRANVPVVPLAITASAIGNTAALAWVGSETLGANLPRVLALRDATLGRHFAPPMDSTSSRKHLTASARSAIARRTGECAITSRPEREASEMARATAGRTVSAGIDHLRSSATGFLLALLVGVSLLYAQTPMYEFAPRTPFQGRQWYNPYADLGTGDRRWYRANLHAHSTAWGRMTAGRNAPADVVARYRALGTEIIGVSNYHAATERREAGTFPVYEHGWNVRKAHRLALGATAVDWFDYPLGATRHQQQHLIDRVHASAALVALAHPALRNGYSPDDLRRLANYELLEVLNHFLPPADSAWDAALSGGRPVWLLAGDDSHDIAGTGETGTNYTQVLATGRTDGDVIDALRAGRTVGVRALRHQGTLELVQLGMRGDTLQFTVRGHLHAVRVIGQGGALRAHWMRMGDPSDTVMTLQAIAAARDGYLRVVAEGPAQWLYTNPVVRWNGTSFADGLAVPHGPRTALYRATWVVAYAWLTAGLLVAGLTNRPRRPGRVAPVPPST